MAELMEFRGCASRAYPHNRRECVWCWAFGREQEGKEMDVRAEKIEPETGRRQCVWCGEERQVVKMDMTISYRPINDGRRTLEMGTENVAKALKYAFGDCSPLILSAGGHLNHRRTLKAMAMACNLVPNPYNELLDALDITGKIAIEFRY